MAFDLDALMQDPQFQMGLGILGGASPGHAGLLNAYNIMQQRKKAELDAQHQARQMQLEEARAQQAREQARLYGVQVEQQQRKLDQQSEMQERGLKFLESLRGGGQPAPQAPLQQPQAAQPLAQPQVEVGKYGTPKAILDNLMQVESGGNPYAIGPDIGGGVKAQGAFQFLPSTVKMLKDKGLEFNPFNPEQARDAADFYIQDLAKQHGGDYAKALAAYGGFKTKDASSYVSRVMQGSPEKQTQQLGQLQAQAQLQSQSEAYKRAQQEVGALRFMGGDIGGLSDVVQGMKPDYEAQRLQTEQGGLAVRQQAERREQTREQRIAGKELREANTQFAKDKAAYSLVSSSADRMEQAVDKLLTHPGLPSITGFSAYTNPIAIKGQPAYGALADLESLTSKLVNDTLQAIRQASENGASGYGQFTEKELGVIKNYIANLDPGRPDFVQALQQVKQYAQEIKNRSSALYEESTGKSAIEGLPQGARKVGTSGGKAVYRLPDGSMVREK